MNYSCSGVLIKLIRVKTSIHYDSQVKVPDGSKYVHTEDERTRGHRAFKNT